MRNLLYFFILYLSMFFISYSQVRPYQTTKMISNSGAGIASILMIESIHLNPASSAFFNSPSFYAEHKKGKLSPDPSRGNDIFEEPRATMLAIGDTSSKNKGLGSYTKIEELGVTSTMYSLNASTGISPNSSFGFNYHYIVNEESTLNNKYKDHRLDFGYLLISSNDLSFGLTFQDVFKTTEKVSLMTTGFQYRLTSQIAYILDLGYNFDESLSRSFFYKTAIQLSIFKDLLFKTGLYDDKNLNLKGGSWGVAWIGPRLSLELGYKNSKRRDPLASFLYANEKLKEISLSMNILF